jgi:Flp pilus assembly protein TadG
MDRSNPKTTRLPVAPSGFVPTGRAQSRRAQAGVDTIFATSSRSTWVRASRRNRLLTTKPGRLRGCRLAVAGRFRGRGRVHGGESGQSIVEFAIVLPILILVVMGIFKFGTAYNNYIQLTNAVDAGARRFSIERGQVNPCADVATEVDAASALNTANITITMMAQDQTTSGQVSQVVTTSTTAANCRWSSSDTTNYAGGGQMVSGTPATVTATYPVSLSFFGLTLGSSTLSVSADESVE